MAAYLSPGDGARITDPTQHAVDSPRSPDDPFLNTPQNNHRAPRFAPFDNDAFEIQAQTSPAQAKRALEAHLAETERRIEEASKLGTTLLRQRKDLDEQIKEIEKQQGGSELGPELRQKLAEIEKEYIEVGQESARAFFPPRSRVVSSEVGLGAPSPKDPRATSPSLFASQATNSPSKLNIPSRRQRNQPSGRVHDIEFATEISTALLAQVRQLQAVIAERDETLKALNAEKSKLEIESEALAERLHNLDESEQKFKDENWNLETQTHELIAAAKEASGREQRLNQGLNAAHAEKSAILRELDELKQTNTKLAEESAANRKQLEAELAGMRRNFMMGESEKGALHRKVSELESQNHELAKAVAGRLRGDEARQVIEVPMAGEEDIEDDSTSDPSPNASPAKGTPRHTGLETETLRSSLHHAHRMIQNLKSTIHREKAEKIELKRVLQEAKDELEIKKAEANPGFSGSAGKRKKNAAQNDRFKKPPRPNMLGAGRESKNEIIDDEEEWEDHQEGASPEHDKRFEKKLTSPRGKRHSMSRVPPVHHHARGTDLSEAFETAHETSDAFETAEEREGTTTETDAFQTGAESFGGDSSDELTETETVTIRGGTIRSRKPSGLEVAANRNSYLSTASTSADELDYDSEPRTPLHSQQERFRLRMNRGAAHRRSRVGSDGGLYRSDSVSAKSSPVSVLSNESPAAPVGNSLFAELGDLNGGDDSEEEEEGEEVELTPRRTRAVSQTSSTLARSFGATRDQFSVSKPQLHPKPEMSDMGIMTEPWNPEPAIHEEAGDEKEPATAALVAATPSSALSTIESQHTEPLVPDPSTKLGISAVSAQEFVPQIPEVPAPPPLQLSEVNIQHTEPQHVEPPPSVPLQLSNVSAQHTEPVRPPSPVTQSLNISQVQSLHTEPREPVVLVSAPADSSHENPQADEPRTLTSAAPQYQESPSPVQLEFSGVSTQNIEPVRPSSPLPESLDLSHVSTQSTEPVRPQSPVPAPLDLSNVSAQATEPQRPTSPIPTSLELSAISTQDTRPLVPELKEEAPVHLTAPTPPSLEFSTIVSEETEPVADSTPATARAIFASDVNGEKTTANAATVKDESKSEESKAGVLGSIFGWGKGSASRQPEIAEDETSQKSSGEVPIETEKSKLPLQSVSSNIASKRPEQKELGLQATASKPFDMADQSSQTLLSASQIDNLFKEISDKPEMAAGSFVRSPTASTLDQSVHGGLERTFSQDSMPSSPRSRTRRTGVGLAAGEASPVKAPRRPGSPGSIRSLASNHPPLPVDHKQTIAAASRRMSGGEGSGITMGPPLQPASAYKGQPHLRPQTPSSQHQQQHSPASKAGTASRPRRLSSVRSEMSSALTRRSSVTSFASELDERFNIRPDGFMPYDMAGGTDPRMIEAITQTMIGDYLWKYTRKAGRGELSANRHRRYFWVHPYTRTLYWSDRDPSTAGRLELKAKSVQIEGVRVVTDDNPMPPGLHRKSLVVVTPGRAIKCTAATGQRHETWFNALSYLLLRTGGEVSGDAGGPDRSQSRNTTREDGQSVDARSSTRTRTIGVSSRASLSSYNSRTTRNTSPRRHPSGVATLRPSPAGVSRSRASQPHGSLSRLSSMFRSGAPPGGVHGSFSGRRSKQSIRDDSIYDASMVNDSAEDLRQVIERQERDSSRLENVRACCDGKHDVGSLTRRGGRHSALHIHHHNHSHHAPSQQGSMRGAPSHRT
ncbi:hypothetical protein L228DRAFT_268315 [Xylona heveae TC161]|uniref:PH domain-containing protein n=1 Tax=Xylona heveae (strain CBS 132557 / TC161) TaxID=1328760 RepID=A0A161TBB1_XYLHT|nr:hypothetical protein L228DRAFT_268315 [Xylona heveae TC161]KZF22947.1 hypothetical protein L228DRAFT_268315 [Xylona heveae TC161]